MSLSEKTCNCVIIKLSACNSEFYKNNWIDFIFFTMPNNSIKKNSKWFRTV